MNKYQRREIDGYIGQIENIAENSEWYDCSDEVNSIKNAVECIRDDEQEKWDNMPENMQYSQRADDYEQIVDYLDDAVCSLDDAYDRIVEDEPDWDSVRDSLNDASSALEDAVGV